MNLRCIRIQNFRRLKNVLIELETSTSIFVGANNSGKTSATQAFQLFLSESSDRVSIHDFGADCWAKFNTLGLSENTTIADFPSITLDLWFSAKEEDLHRVIDLLPSLEWKDALLGVRIEFAAKDSTQLLSRFHEAMQKAIGSRASKEVNHLGPWPKTMIDYLSRRLNTEFEKRYFILDRADFDKDFKQTDRFKSRPLGDTARPGAKVLRSLIKVDFLNAQRHISDVSSPGRSEDLSKRLSRFYERNLEQRSDEEAFDALRALATSEDQLNLHLEKVFTPTLQRLNTLGYPGFYDPKLVIRSALNPETIMKQNAQVHYSIDVPRELGEPVILPDKYNGLGFKNLIYMVIEILDFHERWVNELEHRPPLHLVFIEEPEAHLHAQLQQVFIRKVWDILPKEDQGVSGFETQLVVTTHSPHMVYESGFSPIRYFRRKGSKDAVQSSEVLNLSCFYEETEEATREFLQKYMRQTHCDLFFADATILVEGNVERLLLPLMIDKVAPELKRHYLSIMEVGGAFAHCFKSLIEFLGVPTVVITDLDSVTLVEQKSDGDLEEDVPAKSACHTLTADAVTSNETLKQWLPKLVSVSELLAASSDKKIQHSSPDSPAVIRVCYQTTEAISWNKEEGKIAGRTFEEAFAYRNMAFCQDSDRRALGLYVLPRKGQCTLNQLVEKVFQRVNANLKKTEFALGLMAVDSKFWEVPSYIQEGLVWLKAQLAPVKVGATTSTLIPEPTNDTAN